ncbi:hypothetical protein J3369_02580 [Alteromonas sp. NFXS44]|uniref:hypothetical protein n=1 Tax=Alteromonas sp. NFXS44 TaxID=2818435 RepID=UPI0032DF2907
MLKNAIFLIVSCSPLLFGCSKENTALDRCLQTEVANLQELTTGAYNLKVNEYVSPYYSERVQNALEAFTSVYLPERIKVIESKRNVYGADPAYANALKERDDFLLQSGFLELRKHGVELMFDEISEEEFRRFTEQCDNDPECAKGAEILKSWNDEWESKWSELYEKLARPEFKVEIKELRASLQEVLGALEYKDWEALTPIESQKTLKNIMGNVSLKPNTKGSDLQRKSKDVATMLILNIDYEMGEDLEPFPYDNLYRKMKADHENGTYRDWLNNRLKSIVYKPTVNELAAKVCQSRGVY